MATLTKPSADLTISRFEDSTNICIVFKRSETREGLRKATDRDKFFCFLFFPMSMFEILIMHNHVIDGIPLNSNNNLDKLVIVALIICGVEPANPAVTIIKYSAIVASTVQ